MSGLCYKCDYCMTFMWDERSIYAHESVCAFNPKNQRCFTCENLNDYEHCTKDVDFSFSEEMKEEEYVGVLNCEHYKRRKK